MPIEFKPNKHLSYFTARWVGPLTDAELISSYKKFLRSDEWSSGLSVVCDISEADLSGFAGEVSLDRTPSLQSLSGR